MAKLRERSIGDLLILLIAGTICVSVLVAAATIGIAKIANPDTNTERAAGILADVINTLIGLLAGFLAGRTNANQRARQDKDEPE